MIKNEKIIDAILNKLEDARNDFRNYEKRKFEEAIEAFGKEHVLIYITMLNNDEGSNNFYIVRQSPAAKCGAKQLI